MHILFLYDDFCYAQFTLKSLFWLFFVYVSALKILFFSFYSLLISASGSCKLFPGFDGLFWTWQTMWGLFLKLILNAIPNTTCLFKIKSRVSMKIGLKEILSNIFYLEISIFNCFSALKFRFPIVFLRNFILELFFCL